MVSHPLQYVINFSDAVNTPSSSAFTVNGQSAGGVSMSNSNTTATFTFGTDPVASIGTQTMAIAAGAITRQGDNNPIEAFSATFTVTSLTVSTATPSMTS